MNIQRGDVVLVDFPFSKGEGSKVRPALVIQNNTDNTRLLNTIVAQITGTTHRELAPTQVLIEFNTPDGEQTGLRFDSVVNCVNVLTLEKGKVFRKLGQLSGEFMQKVNSALKSALDLQ